MLRGESLLPAGRFGVSHRDHRDVISTTTHVTLAELEEDVGPLFIIFPGIGIYVRLSAAVAVLFKGCMNCSPMLHGHSLLVTYVL